MFVYRARLCDGAELLLPVAVRRRPVEHALGAPPRRGRFRITIRYAAPDGVVHTHRGDLLADVPEGVTLTTASWQMADGEALLTFRPAPPGGRTGRELIITDGFRLPFSLKFSGVSDTDNVTCVVRVVCRAWGGGGLAIRGRVLLRANAAAGLIRAPIPFMRLLAIDAEPGLRWKATANLSGLRLTAGPSGTTEGELTLTLRCDGRHPIRRGGAPPDVAHVRDVTGKVARATADAIGTGCAVVNGALELDVYWFDRQGRSRWTGRQVTFSTLVELPGAEEGDVLEPSVRIQRLARVGVEVHVLVEATVTALRAERVDLVAGCYRLERVVGSAATCIWLVESLWGERQRAPTRGTVTAQPPTRGTVAALPPTRGTVAALPPTRGTVAALPLTQRTATVMPPTMMPPGDVDAEVALPLPGPITGIEAVTITGKCVTAIVRLPGGKRWRMAAAAPFHLPSTAGRIVSATACPVVVNGAWHLRLIVTVHAAQ